MVFAAIEVGTILRVGKDGSFQRGGQICTVRIHRCRIARAELGSYLVCIIHGLKGKDHTG